MSDKIQELLSSSLKYLTQHYLKHLPIFFLISGNLKGKIKTWQWPTDKDSQMDFHIINY